MITDVVEDVKEGVEDAVDAVGDFFGGLFGGGNGAGVTAQAVGSTSQGMKFSGDGDASDPSLAKSAGFAQMDLADFIKKAQSPVVIDAKKGLTDNILMDDPAKLKALLGGEPQIKGPDIGPDPAPFAKMAAFDKVDAFDGNDDGGFANMKMNAQFDFMV